MSESHVSLINRQTGASAVEYALILGILATIFIAGFILLGGDLETVFTNISTALGGLGGGGGGGA